MSLIDKLLQADAKKITELPTKKYEIVRLSELLKGKFELELQAIPGKKYTEIQQNGVDIAKNGGIKNVKVFDIQTLTLLAGIKEPSMKDKRLMDHFNALTPKELIEKLFLAGEIADIRKEIEKLSGYESEDDNEQKDEADEIKN